MLFNSSTFIFVFLPAAVLGFYLLGRLSRAGALVWLILVSAVFYALWRPVNVLIIAPSILVNYLLARALLRLNEDGKRPRASQGVLLLGIAFNVAFLGYFKYVNFLVGTINDVFGANIVLARIILPLGISFITFQKIAFLIDVQAGRVKSFTLRDYCLFVLFFPQLIAGPIVHFREMMPQFHQAPCRFDKENVAVALTLFFFGLFKKLVLADTIAPLVTPVYVQAAAGGGTTLLPAWIAALGFTLQIYFDFSGYSDMALGLARFFGIRLPPNFDSPLRASSIIDFWLRWHMTLTRFLTAYIYNPLLVALTRRRAAKGLPAFGGRNTTVGAFVYLLMFPTVLTMLVSGLWHGAGYLFIIWGVLQGIYLTVNHAWRLLARRWWPTTPRPLLLRVLARLLTLLSVAFGMVFFRSGSFAGALDLIRGMVGLNGTGLALPYHRLEAPVVWLSKLVPMLAPSSPTGTAAMVVCWLAVPAFIAFCCPNTLDILARYQPALGVNAANRPDRGLTLRWRPSLGWAIALSVISAAGVLSLGAESDFLYWQF